MSTIIVGIPASEVRSTAVNNAAIVAIIIGFGKGGKTLDGALANRGHVVANIECWVFFAKKYILSYDKIDDNAHYDEEIFLRIVVKRKSEYGIIHVK